MMNNAFAWMTGWTGGGMWIWPLIGVVVAVLLIVVVIRVTRR